MENINELTRYLQYELRTAQSKLQKLEQRYLELDQHSGTIVIKQIQGIPYYYEQGIENGKMKYRSLGRVKPGMNWEWEQQTLEQKELRRQIRDLKELCVSLEKFDSKVSRKETILPEYTFEVYWKDEITASVRTKGAQVSVARFVKHPLRQLFPADRITRYQLNSVLEQRCFERGREDILQILQRLGLQEYDPYQIVKRTHGVSYNDFLWFRFPGENLTAKDVLVR